MRSTKEYRSQLEAAYILLEGDTTTLEKFEKIKSLIGGINPDLDKKLAAVTSSLNHLKALWNTDVIHFATHSLREKTPREKKRKKALLLFIASWRSLKSEVARVQGYYQESASDPGATASAVAKTGLFAKGPFGVITFAAVAIVGVGLLLRQASTTIEISNKGCAPLSVPAELPFKLPGLRLPSSPIVSGVPASATLPALTVDVHSTNSAITATIFGQSGSYSLPRGVTNISFDGTPLLGTTTTLKLSTSKSHSLVISCN